MNITIYTSSSCPWCVKAKRYLDSKNIEYREVNVSGNLLGALEMKMKSGQSAVPVIDIDGDVIVGFNKKAIDRSLARKY
ncbi:MAG: NrdH-redoxin [Clostridiales bacterium]|uniref:glutaredoxin family protein n=1 Tax=Clostridium sp. N3C TaxID=1776758 RepID=UPI00092E0507|nr:glutaredoxin domain-containing protein [Clostridium sp. N3C]NLZ49789.1 NrdH-redoxin [Clostridiales bacterium]SCN23357.1 Glutaredoxin-3 [Clostridium sp. N3C]